MFPIQNADASDIKLMDTLFFLISRCDACKEKKFCTSKQTTLNNMSNGYHLFIFHISVEWLNESCALQCRYALVNPFYCVDPKWQKSTSTQWLNRHVYIKFIFIEQPQNFGIYRAKIEHQNNDEKRKETETRQTLIQWWFRFIMQTHSQQCNDDSNNDGDIWLAPNHFNAAERIIVMLW